MTTDRLTLIQNLVTGAVTQGSDELAFNSYAKFGDKILGAREDGLYILGGDDFDEAAIAADFEFTYDFTQSVVIRSLWLGLQASGNMQLTLTFDGRADRARTYTITPTNTTIGQQHGLNVPVGRSDYGRYLSFQFRNVSGCDFSLDYVSGVVIPLGLRKVLSCL